jgi:hypothetical protein
MSLKEILNLGLGGLGHAVQTRKTYVKSHKPEERLEEIKKHATQEVDKYCPSKGTWFKGLFTNIFFPTSQEIEKIHAEHTAKYPLAVAEEGKVLTEAQEKENEKHTKKIAKETLGSLRWRSLDKLATTAITAQNTCGILADIFNIFSSDQKGTAFANLIKDSTCFIVGLLPVNSVAAQLAIQFALNYFSGFLYSIFGSWDANPQGQQPQMAYQQSPNPNGMPPAQSNYLANGLNANSQYSRSQSGETLSYCV